MISSGEGTRGGADTSGETLAWSTRYWPIVNGVCAWFPTCRGVGCCFLFLEVATPNFVFTSQVRH